MKKIIGCGNLLLKDEGIGVHLIEYLRRVDLPVDVELVDAACGGFDIMPHLDKVEKVVIVDAMQAGGSPGDIYKFGLDDFSIDTPPNMSLHDISLKDVLLLSQRLAPLPSITIFGIEPKEMKWGMELTPEVKKILPRLARLVIKEIENA
ncbi:MAG: hydrogenase maturation protease [Candidatus Omnitrophica bacterium]|nr:hydrogenase maturation protease [Candidatus Omnitrophota bacterium]